MRPNTAVLGITCFIEGIQCSTQGEWEKENGGKKKTLKSWWRLQKWENAALEQGSNATFLSPIALMKHRRSIQHVQKTNVLHIQVNISSMCGSWPWYLEKAQPLLSPPKHWVHYSVFLNTLHWGTGHQEFLVFITKIHYASTYIHYIFESIFPIKHDTNKSALYNTHFYKSIS